VALAALTYNPPHLLILDEPCNHLDFDTIQAFTDAIHNYAGGVVVVSHDRRFMGDVAKEVYEIKQTSLVRLEGGLQEVWSKSMDWFEMSVLCCRHHRLTICMAVLLLPLLLLQYLNKVQRLVDRNTS